MPGTGSGPLQPTKLIQNDDFMETIALPGYVQSGSQRLHVDTALALATFIYVVPDGMTVEVMDAGVTFNSDETIDGTNRIAIAIATVSYVGGGAVARVKDIIAPTLMNTAIAAGDTRSISRGDFAFDGDSTAVSNKFGGGTIFAWELTAQTGSPATLAGDVWLRLKYTAKDNGNI